MNRHPANVLALAGVTLLALGLGAARAQEAEVPPRPTPARLSLDQPRAVTSLDIDPRGETLAATGLDGAVRLWSLATGRPGSVFEVHQGDAAVVRFTPEGGRLLTTGADGRVALLDVRSGQISRTWQFPTWCLGLAVVDADTAAVGCADLRIRLLNLEDGRTEQEIQAPGESQYQYVSSLSASPDGRLLVTNNPATVFEVETGEPLRTSGSFVQRLVFSPDGRTLLGGNMKAGAQLWSIDPLRVRVGVETDVEQEVQTPAGRRTVRQRMPIYGVAWSPDGRFFATGGLDLLVRVWRVEEEGPPTEMVRLAGHASAISSIVWKGDHLVSGDLGGQIRIWPSQAFLQN